MGIAQELTDAARARFKGIGAREPKRLSSIEDVLRDYCPTIEGYGREASPDVCLVQSVLDSRYGWELMRFGFSLEDIGREMADVRVTEDHLAEAFGPHWGDVVGVVRQAAELTTDRVKRMAEVLEDGREDSDIWACTWQSIPELAHRAAFPARRAMEEAVMGASRDTPWGEPPPVPPGSERGPVWRPRRTRLYGAAGQGAKFAALAVSAQHRIPRETVDVLMAPWRAAFA